MQIIKDMEKTALVSGSMRLSYSGFMHITARVSEQLACEPCERIAIFAENSPQWAFVLYAVWQKRGICVPVDHLSSVDDLAHILNDCRPKSIFCSQTTSETARQAMAAAGVETTLLLLEDLDVSPAEADPPAPALDRDLQDTALIMYTSGTTGDSKGVMLSFENLKTNYDGFSKAKIYTPDQRILVMLPLHHILPLVGTLIGAFHCGCTIIFSPSLSPSDILQTLQQHGVTMIIGVPRFYSLITDNIRAKIAASPVARGLYALAKCVGSQRFSSIIFKSVQRKFGGHMQFLVSGGAPLDPAVAECLETLGFCVLEGYGMTEAAPMITFPRPAHYKLGACGQALEACEVRINDGEIITRGPNVMQGYYNRPDETAAVIKDGWLYTGDLGKLDDEGFLYVTGRKKEIIVLPNGKNINPNELEEKLIHIIPELEEAAVFMDGHALHALLRLREDAGPVSNAPDVAHDELLSRYNEQATPYKRIQRFTIVSEELPRTRMGKIKRFLLPQMAGPAPAPATRPPEPDTDTYHQLKQFIGTLVSTPVYADARLGSDLALDSLGRLSLQVFIHESYGIDLKDSDFQRLTTLRQLADYTHLQKVSSDVGAVDWPRILQAAPDLPLPYSGIIHSGLILLTRLFVRLAFRFRVSGRDRLPRDPFILAANHQCFIDGLFIAAALHAAQMRHTFFFAKEQHVRGRFLQFMARRNNMIVVDINNKLMRSVQQLAAALQQGKNVIIFPEGTRTKTGQMGAFKPTFAILSRELDIPIVPVTIQGAYEILPKGKRVPRLFKKITVTIHDPIQPAQEDYHALSDRVRHVIESEIS